ncbi:unnamed protein product [Leuciscus chuanchicus]
MLAQRHLWLTLANLPERDRNRTDLPESLRGSVLAGWLQQQHRDPALGGWASANTAYTAGRVGKEGPSPGEGNIFLRMKEGAFKFLARRLGRNICPEPAAFFGDAGDPHCQPQAVARMRTNTVGSSHNSVRLSSEVPFAPCFGGQRGRWFHKGR